MQEYEGNMTEYVENMKEYVKNMKKYVNILDLAFPYLYGLPPGLWDLEKFHTGASSQALRLRKILRSASMQVLGFEKMLSFPFLRLQPVGEAPSVARCEVTLFCLLHISSKLFLLTYSASVWGGNFPTRAVSTQHLSSQQQTFSPPYIGFGTWKNSESSLPPPILKNMKHVLYFLARPRNFS